MEGKNHLLKHTLVPYYYAPRVPSRCGRGTIIVLLLHLRLFVTPFSIWCGVYFSPLDFFRFFSPPLYPLDCDSHKKKERKHVPTAADSH